jgi:predicted metal-dependent hydrolase
MQKQIQYGESSLEYELVRDDRRCMTVHVKPDGSVAVKTPLHLAEEEVLAFVQSKIRWILKQRERFARCEPQPARQYVSGDIFRYLGRPYRLCVQQAAGPERVCAAEGELRVCSRRPHSALSTRRLVERWFEEEALRVFAAQLALCSQKFGLSTPPPLIIRRMKTRLGSYSTRTRRVCLNLELIAIDLHLIDYVIIHELCHIRHLAHDKAFYFELSRHLPGWRQLEAELRRARRGGL